MKIFIAVLLFVFLSSCGYKGSANAYRSAGGKFNGFSQYVSGRSGRIAIVEKIEKAKAIEKTKNELYREARGNFSGFLV